MSTELHLSPEWTVDISGVQEVGADEKLIAYRLSQNLGYFTEEGKIASNITFPFKSAISDKWYCTYAANNTVASFYNPDGTKAGEIDVPGFPFFQKDRIYVFLPGGTSFAEYTSEGEKKWSFEGFSPVTAFSSCQSGTVAGFADGTVISFNNAGRIDQKFTPGGSETAVILGADISSDALRIACVSGQGRQRFVVAEKNDGHSKVIFHEYVPSELNRQTLVKFSNDGNTVFYNFSGGLGIVDLVKAESKKISLRGKVSQVEFSETSNLTFVLSHSERNYTVTVLEAFNHPVASFNFSGDSAFIQVRGDKLFVGRDNKISCISISRK